MTIPIVGITGEEKNGKYTLRMEYADAIEKSGACPVFLSPSSKKNSIAKIAVTIDALIISGGGNFCPSFYGEKHKKTLNPVSDKRFYFETCLLRKIMLLKKPVLGICYGMQFLNVFLGGSLYHRIPAKKPGQVRHRSGHLVEINSKSRLYSILRKEKIMVNSSHCQGVKELGKALVPSARSQDKLIEAVELKNYPFFLGLQWHPEKLSDKNSINLFKSFIKSVLQAKLSGN